MSQQPTNALLKRFKDGNKERFPDIGNVISEIGGEWAFKTIILSMEDYADEQTASLQKQVELLQIRDGKREARESNLHKENGGLHAQIESLQNQVHALEVQKKAILQREAETNRLYKKQVEELREENEDLGDRLTMAQEETYDQKCIVDQLQAENAAANKRIEELFKEKQEIERKYNLLRYGSE